MTFQDGNTLRNEMFQNDISDTEETFRELIAEHLIVDDIELPIMPHVAAQVLKLTAEPDFSYGDLTRLILTDQVISSRIIQVANSALFGAGQEITSLHHAIIRLGYRCTVNLVLSTSLSSTMVKGEHYGEYGQKLWDHSVGCAFCAKRLAEYAHEGLEEAFLVGLLHDIGKLVYLGISQKILDEKPDVFTNLGDKIGEMMDQFHANMGGVIARRWSFPSLIQNCIRYHHDYTHCYEQQNLAILVNLADSICNYHGYGLVENTEPPWESGVLEFLNIDTEDVREITEALPETISEVRGIFQ